MISVIIRRLQCSAIVSSQFIKSIPKQNSFSIGKNLKSERHVALRSYVCVAPEINKSSELEQDDKKRKVSKDDFYYSNFMSTDPRFSEFFFRKELISQNAHSTLLLFKYLKELSSKPEIVREDLEVLLSHLRTEIQNLTLYELLEAADLTFRLYEKKDKDMWEVIGKHFDKEFLRRRRSLSYTEIFMIINLLNSFNFALKFNFVHKAMFKITFRVAKLSHTEFVVFCYNLKKIRYAKLEKFQFEFMNFINKRVPSLNQMELGLLANAFTATNLIFSPSLFHTVMTKVLNEFENMDTIVLMNICKHLSRISHLNYENLQLFRDFQEKLVPIVSKFYDRQLRGLVCSGMHIGHLNMALYDEVMKRVKSDITNFSLVDIERFVYLNTIFNIDDKEFLDMAVSEFERRDDCLREHITYTKFLGNLIHFQMYPENLLEKALSSDTLMKVEKDKKGRFTWAFLRWSLELEKPEFKFPEINEKLYVRVLKFSKYAKCPQKYGLFYQIRLQWMLENIYGQNSVFSRRVTFLHSNCSIMRFDKNLKAQEIPGEFKEKKNDFTLRPLCDDHIWVCIFPLHIDCYANWDKKIINYRTKTNMRHLSILGYKQIPIQTAEWYPHITKTPSSLNFMEGFMNRKLQELTGEVQHTESEK